MMIRINAIMLMLFIQTILITTSSADDRKSNWFGFDRLDFEVSGVSAILVSPRQPAEGHPWIWRTEFFGHEPQADIGLLHQGFHVAYIDVQNQYGAPTALDRMDHFYDHLVNQRGLSSRAVMEGFSRGGLFALNWAQRHPDRVACIYNDAPVCDFRSWPGGKGKGPGSPSDWERCLKAYGLTETEALTWTGQTIDQLGPLADAGIPLLHVCGDADEVVPFDENTLLLADRYRKLGGHITIIAKPGIKHHPHSLQNPHPIVQFVRHHVASKESLPALIESPAERQVFQRNRDNTADVLISGWATYPGTVLEFRIDQQTAAEPGFGSKEVVSWFQVQSDPKTGRFETVVTISAGSEYSLTGRVQRAGTVPARISHWGVGEVFVVAGQSNSTNYGSERQRTQSGLVSTFDGAVWSVCEDPQPGTADGSTGGSFLPAFGDRLARELNVPIAVTSTGAGATSVRQWLPRGVPFRNRPTIDAWIKPVGDNQWESSGELFARLTNRLDKLGKHGCRAVLWHQGESDAGQARAGYPAEYQITGAQYEGFMKALILGSRERCGWDVPWITATATYHSEADPADEEFRAAQAAVSASGLSIAGPDTDTLRIPYRDGVHFNAEGQRRHGELWAEAVLKWMKQRRVG